MCQHFVLADQCGRGNLCHHESGIQTGSFGQKWRQAFAESGVYEAFESPLADACQRAQCNTEEIQSESQRFTMKVAAGNDVARDP